MRLVEAAARLAVCRFGDRGRGPGCNALLAITPSLKLVESALWRSAWGWQRFSVWLGFGDRPRYVSKILSRPRGKKPRTPAAIAGSARLSGRGLSDRTVPGRAQV